MEERLVRMVEYKLINQSIGSITAIDLLRVRKINTLVKLMNAIIYAAVSAACNHSYNEILLKESLENNY